MVTDASGNIKEESDYYPFGGERVVTDLGIGNNYKFTGKERDPETGCDYFGARYYCNPIGRFITPDWADTPTDVPYANFGNPQSLNLYSYVKNNPTTFGDPDGHETQATLDDQETREAGEVIAGAVKGLYNLGAGTWNFGAELLNKQGRASGQPHIELPLAPMATYDNDTQAIAAGVTQLTVVVADGIAGMKGTAAKDPAPEPYNRTEHYGNPSSSTTAKEIRANGEGQSCPNCGQTMKSGTKTAPTAEHQPTLKSHYYEKGGSKMTPAERRAYARSSKAMQKDAVCKTCQSKQGAAEAKKQYQSQ